MSNENLHIEPSGRITKPRTQSPKTIHAWGHARESFARVVIGGIVLTILTVTFCIALANENPAADKILILISTGLGFLLGRGSKSGGSEE